MSETRVCASLHEFDAVGAEVLEFAGETQEVAGGWKTCQTGCESCSISASKHRDVAVMAQTARH